LARIPSLILGILLGCLIWRWAHALFGAWSGVLALFLYTFCPNVLAHAHLVTTDIATTFAMFAATYTFWRYLTAPSRGGLLLAAIAFGGAQLTKATALFLVPIFAVILGVRALRGAMRKSGNARHALAGAARGQLRELLRPALRFLVFGIVALAVLNTGFRFEGTGTPLKRYARFVSPGCQWLAGFPLLRDIPLPLPYPYLQGLDMVSRDSRGGPWSYLRGRYSETGFRSYFLWGFLVKVPLATQILIGFAFWLWGSGRVRAPGAARLPASGSSSTASETRPARQGPKVAFVPPVWSSRPTCIERQHASQANSLDL
jgi:hypothetical protein